MVRTGVHTSALADADFVVAARDGDPTAFSTLFDRWFDRCYDVAVRIVHSRETAADVAQDTFLSAWRNLGSLRDPQAFGGWVLRTSRNTALTRLERDRRSVALGDETTSALADAARPGPDAADAVTRREQHDLVWAAAAALGERDASVLDLHLRHGLEPGEIAEALGINANNAHQVLFRLRSRLGGAVQAWILWNDGAPRCEELGEILAAAGVASFGPDAVKLISRHADGCPVCEDQRAAALAPEAMFASVPVLVAPAALRDRVRSGLDAEGVPMTAGPRSRSRVAVGAGVVAAVVLLVAAVVLLTRDDAPVDDTEVATADPGGPTTTTGPGGEPSDETDPSTLGSIAQAATTSTSVAAVTPTDELPVAPGGPTTTGPATDSGTVSSSVAPTPPDTDPTTPPPVAPAPTIADFTATLTGLGPCGSSSGRLWELAWSTLDATEVTVTGPTVAPGPHPPTGSLSTCTGFGPAPTWELTATGPGGSSTTTVTG